MVRTNFELEKRWLAWREKDSALQAELAELTELSQEAVKLGYTVNAVKVKASYPAWDAQANEALAMLHEIQIPLSKPKLDTTKATLLPLLKAKGLEPIEKLIQGSCTQNYEFTPEKLAAMEQGNQTLDMHIEKKTKRPIKE